jgi:hypothetical protein
MKKSIARLFGILMILVALTGVAMSVGGIVFVLRVKDTVKNEAVTDLDLVLHAMDSVSDGVNTTSASLDTTISAIDNIYGTVQNADATLENSTHFLDTSAHLFGDILPDTIVSAQTAIGSASISAKMVDDTLGIITNIPIIGEKYKPDVPLSKALNNISVAIDKLPTDFKGMEDDFVEIKGDMADFSKRLKNSQEQLSNIKGSIKQAKEVITKIQGTISELKTKGTVLKEKLPLLIKTVTWGSIVFLSGLPWRNWV